MPLDLIVTRDLLALPQGHKVSDKVLRPARFVSDALKTWVSTEPGPQSIDRLAEHCRSLTEFYQAAPEAGIKFAGAIFERIITTKLSPPKDTSENLSKRWENVLVSILFGVLEFLDEDASAARKDLVASAFYTLICSDLFFPRNEAASTPGSKLCHLSYDLLTSTANLHVRNKEVLRDPSFLGSERIGVTLTRTKELSSLEELLSLVAVLLPDTARDPSRRKERSDFISGVCLPTGRITPGKDQKLVSLLERLSNKNWSAILTQLINEFALIDISFPQPFDTSAVVVCGQSLPTQTLFLDSDGLSAHVLRDGEEDEQLKLPLETILSVSVAPVHSQLRVHIELSECPHLERKNLLSAQEHETPKLSFNVSMEHEKRWIAGVRAHGLTVHKEPRALRASVTTRTLRVADEISQPFEPSFDSTTDKYGVRNRTPSPIEELEPTSADDAVFQQYIHYPSDLSPALKKLAPKDIGTSTPDANRARKKRGGANLSEIFGRDGDELSDISDYSDENPTGALEKLPIDKPAPPKGEVAPPEGHESDTSATAINSDTRLAIPSESLPSPPQSERKLGPSEAQTPDIPPPREMPTQVSTRTRKRKAGAMDPGEPSSISAARSTPPPAGKRPKRGVEQPHTKIKKQADTHHSHGHSTQRPPSISNPLFDFDTLPGNSPASSPAPRRTSPRLRSITSPSRVEPAPAPKSRVTAMKKKTGSTAIAKTTKGPKAPPRPRPKKKAVPPTLPLPPTPTAMQIPASDGSTAPASPSVLHLSSVPHVAEPALASDPTDPEDEPLLLRKSNKIKALPRTVAESPEHVQMDGASRNELPEAAEKNKHEDAKQVRTEKLKAKAERAKKAKEERAEKAKREKAAKTKVQKELVVNESTSPPRPAVLDEEIALDLDAPSPSNEPLFAKQEEQVITPVMSTQPLLADGERTLSSQQDSTSELSDAEHGRKQKLLQEDLCEVLGPHQAKCLRCDQVIQLSKKMKYALSQWEKHRHSCRRKLSGYPPLPTASDRESRLRQDALCEVVGSDEVKCLRCDQIVTLSKSIKFERDNWEKHRKSCLLKPVGSSVPSMVDNQEDDLRQDALCEVLSPYEVKCLRCDGHVALSKRSEFDASNWKEHREMCLKQPIGYTHPLAVRTDQDTEEKAGDLPDVPLQPSPSAVQEFNFAPISPNAIETPPPPPRRRVSRMQMRETPVVSAPAQLTPPPVGTVRSITIDLTSDSPPPTKTTPQASTSLDLSPEPTNRDVLHFELPASPMSPPRRPIRTSSSPPLQHLTPTEPRARPRVTFAPLAEERYFTDYDPKRKLDAPRSRAQGKAPLGGSGASPLNGASESPFNRFPLSPSIFDEDPKEKDNRNDFLNTERFAVVIDDIAEAIKHQIRSGIKGVRDQAYAARREILHKAASDLENMQEECVALFNRLVDLEREYAIWGQHRQEDFLKFRESTHHARGMVREVIEEQDRNPTSKKIPTSLFGGIPMPASLRR